MQELQPDLMAEAVQTATHHKMKIEFLDAAVEASAKGITINVGKDEGRARGNMELAFYFAVMNLNERLKDESRTYTTV